MTVPCARLTAPPVTVLMTMPSATSWADVQPR